MKICSNKKINYEKKFKQFLIYANYAGVFC